MVLQGQDIVSVERNPVDQDRENVGYHCCPVTTHYGTETRFLILWNSQPHNLSCEQHSPLWGQLNKIMDVELIFKSTNIIHK